MIDVSSRHNVNHSLENDIIVFYNNQESNSLLLDKLICDIVESKLNSKSKNKYLSKVFKMIYQIRDIEYGLGNRDMAYMMIHVWSKYHLTMAKVALKSFVTLSGFASSNEKPYGSWKDIKYFCNYVMKTSNTTREPMIEYAIELMCSQIRDDYTCVVYGGDKSTISLCARWVPRETSLKFGWLFKLIALHYIPNYHATAITRESLDRACKKTYREFSKIITGLNRVLDTVQIKMCANEWANINHTKLTCLTVVKGSAAFLNVSKRRGPVMENGRIQCATNFKNCMSQYHLRKRIDTIDNYIQRQKSDVSMYELVKIAMDPYANEYINRKWKTMMEKRSVDFTNMIAMIDMSASMCIDYATPLYTALGLGIAIAEKSYIGRRVLSFSTTPMWISLETCDTFSECVSELSNNCMTSGSAIHIYMALNQILNVCIEKTVANDTLIKTVLVIFTDMDLLMADVNYHTEMIRHIREKYMGAGYSDIPHILFWNVYQTDPIVSHSKSGSGSNGCIYKSLPIPIPIPKIVITDAVTYVNGCNSWLLDEFMKKGMAAFTEMTKWNMLSAILDVDRYCLVDDFFE